MIMKKIVLTIVAMLSMTFAYAENENVNAIIRDLLYVWV